MNARLRRIVVVSAIVLVSLIILLVAGYSQLMSYLQGNDFRQKMADTLRGSTGAAKVDIASNLTIHSNRISTEGASLSRLKGIREARASRISVEIDRMALLSRKLRIHKLTMEEAVLSLHTGTAAVKNEAPAKKKTRKRSKKKAVASSPKKEGSAFELRGYELELLE